MRWRARRRNVRKLCWGLIYQLEASERRKGCLPLEHLGDQTRLGSEIVQGEAQLSETQTDILHFLEPKLNTRSPGTGVNTRGVCRFSRRTCWNG